LRKARSGSHEVDRCRIDDGRAGHIESADLDAPRISNAFATLTLARRTNPFLRCSLPCSSRRSHYWVFRSAPPRSRTCR
jgi:hypothetical protein